MASLIYTPGGLPVLTSEIGQLSYVPTAWFVELYKEGKTLLTIKNYASYLKLWVTHLEKCGKSFEDAITHDVRRWRSDLEKNGNLPSTIIQYITITISCYWWAQEAGLVRRSTIGWKDFEKPGQNYQISVRQSDNGSYSIKSLIPKNYGAPPPGVYSIAQVKDLIAKRAEITLSSRNKRSDDIKIALNVRNLLMIRWFSEGCLRAQEIAGLRVTCMPSRPRSHKGVVEVRITHGTKYGKPRTIRVVPSLISETHDYIEMERDDLVQRNLLGKDPGTLFVSSSLGKNGGVLGSGSVKDLIGDAGADLSSHNLRSYGLFQLACALYAIEKKKVADTGDRKRINTELIYMKLKQQAGHENIDTTFEHYVNLAAVVYDSKDTLEFLEEEEARLELQLRLTQEERRKLMEMAETAAAIE